MHKHGGKPRIGHRIAPGGRAYGDRRRSRHDDRASERPDAAVRRKGAIVAGDPLGRDGSGNGLGGARSQSPCGAPTADDRSDRGAARVLRPDGQDTSFSRTTTAGTLRFEVSGLGSVGRNENYARHRGLPVACPGDNCAADNRRRPRADHHCRPDDTTVPPTTTTVPAPTTTTTAPPVTGRGHPCRPRSHRTARVTSPVSSMPSSRASPTECPPRRRV